MDCVLFKKNDSVIFVEFADEYKHSNNEKDKSNPLKTQLQMDNKYKNQLNSLKINGDNIEYLIVVVNTILYKIIDKERVISPLKIKLMLNGTNIPHYLANGKRVKYFICCSDIEEYDFGRFLSNISQDLI